MYSLRGAGCTIMVVSHILSSSFAVRDGGHSAMSTSDPRNPTDKVDPLGDTLIPANQPGLAPGDATMAQVEAPTGGPPPLPSRGEPASTECPSAHPPGYEILRELGRGGMGVVYLARQVKADRLVALKMIVAGLHASPEVRHRFYTEAEAVARL